MNYKDKMDTVIQKIEDARVSVGEHHIVKLIAVSKYSTAQEIEAMYNAGQRAFGENKVQDLIVKESELEDFPLEWHFIGHLQKNKIKHLVKANPFLIQSLDSIELALQLDKYLQTNGQQIDALLQINSANESTKSGVTPEQALDVYQEILQRCNSINLKGVMSIGAHTDDTKIIQQSFEITHNIYSKISGATICSMGMSHDFELAIKCGSNMVRIGSMLFKD